jgi:hypothetical protein
MVEGASDRLDEIFVVKKIGSRSKKWNRQNAKSELLS